MAVSNIQIMFMMSLTIVVISTFLTLCGTLPLPDKVPLKFPWCSKNEIYEACGISCEKTCASLDVSYFPFGCKLLCVPGCICKPGFVRHRNRRCVPEAKCYNNMKPGEQPRKHFIDNRWV